MTESVSTPIERVTTRVGAGTPTMARCAGLIAQLILAILVVQLYQIEGDAFLRLFILAAAGFVINLVLPTAYRLQFFVLLSLLGIFVVFGVVDGAWLIGSGLALIGLCHLPLPFAVRVAILLATGGVLAASRSGVIASPWAAAVWPILGSMFMFRIALYLHAIKLSGHREPWWALAYFFMLPNVAFPLFPVVDYNTFRRTHYDRDDTLIYEQGLVWISRGLLHLVLYRLVYQRLLLDPVDVVGLGDLVQFMLSTFLLYLRVSGQFHLIVGVLHLFGFRLPETHHLYYLAHNFTELWRRINIYWKDFMMKVVFYPTYFTLRSSGPTFSLVVSTFAVFATTWVLHSYQWFWLRGGFPLTVQDGLFWGILGAFVVVGALREAAGTVKPRQRAPGWNWRAGMAAAATFSVLCFLWSLWSTDSVGRWLWMLSAAASIDGRGVALLVTIITTITILGARDWDKTPGSAPWHARLSPVRPAVTLVLLLVCGQPALEGLVPPAIAGSLQALRTTGLNARDAALQHRGYYEQLDVRGQLNTEVLDVTANNEWKDLSTTGVLRTRHDVLERDLHPSRSVIWNGHTFSTNRWGMRDKEYSREKPVGTLRIALLGPSHVMGNGVSDGETFESLVEERLNREFTDGEHTRFEILNFGVDGYTLTQQVALLEERAFDFSPDVVIVTHYHRGRVMTDRYLLKLVWGDIEAPQQSIAALLARVGLADVDRGSTPVPSPSGRALARWLGLDPRMPYSESEARVHRISNDVIDSSFRRFAEVTASRGAAAMVLGLNAVIDDVPPGIPNDEVTRELGLPVLNLFDVYPNEERRHLRVSPSDDHPNAAGHRLIAARLYDELVQRLRSDALDAHQGVTTTHRSARSGGIE